jgi:hypothetical protein
MELMAAIAALEAMKRPASIDFYTDSQYLRGGVMGWIEGWKRNGWRTADKKPVKNADLWQRLDDATKRHDVAWHWVRGHAGTLGNERADELAREGMKPQAEASRQCRCELANRPATRRGAETTDLDGAAIPPFCMRLNGFARHIAALQLNLRRIHRISIRRFPNHSKTTCENTDATAGEAIYSPEEEKPKASCLWRPGLASWGPACGHGDPCRVGQSRCSGTGIQTDGVPPEAARPEYSVQNSGFAGAAPSSDELVSRRSVEQTSAANRILPDLSRREPLQGARKDETSMAAKPTRSRIRRKQRREPEAQRSSRGRTRRPAAVDGSAVEPAVEDRRTEQPIETRMPMGTPDRGAASEAASDGPARLKRRRKWSPREIRRAAASGAFKATVAGTRNRKRR